MPLRTRVSFAGSAAVGGGVSTMHWRSLGAPPSAAELAGISNAIEQFWTSLCSAAVGVMGASTECSFDGAIEDINPATGQLQAIHTAPSWSVTAASAEIAPRSTQGFLRDRTGFFLQGRELRGGTYIPGIWAALVLGNGSMDSICHDRIVDAAVQHLTVAAAGLGWWQVVYSPTYFTEAAITSHDARSKFAVLTSRRD